MRSSFGATVCLSPPCDGFVTPGDGFVILSIVIVILSEAKDLYKSSSAGPNDK